MMNTVMDLMLRNKRRWRKVENMMKLHQKEKFTQDMMLNESRER